METSAAKAFSKRLMREISNPDLLDEMVPNQEKFLTMSLTRIDRFFTKACSSKKVGVITKFSYGKKRKRYLCCSLLSPEYLNVLNQRGEKMLSCENFVFSLMPEDNETEWMSSFAISHHAVERYFLRTRLQSTAPFTLFLQDFTNECALLNTQIGVLNTLLFDWTKKTVNIVEQGPQAGYGEQISVFLPTQNGAFLGSFQFPRLNIQTYLANEDLTDEQKLKKQTLLPVLQAFQNTPIHLPFFGMARDQSLIDQHSEFAVNLLRLSVGIDALPLLDAMTNQTDDWEQYQMFEAWKNGWGLNSEVKRTDLLALLREGKFEDMFRRLQIQTRLQR